MKNQLGQGERIKNLLPIALYFIAYMMSFEYLEHHVPERLHIISCSIDQYIPFIEYFVVPYFLWFAFIAGTAVYLYFIDFEGFCRFCYTLMIGMTIFIVVSFAYPNGLDIRPTEFARDNIFTDAVKYLYSIDTSTNVLPSIHVYNSICALFAVQECDRLKKNTPVQYGAFILAVLICLSTMFLKQHSVFDVALGLVLSFSGCQLVYGLAPGRQLRQTKGKRQVAYNAKNYLYRSK